MDRYQETAAIRGRSRTFSGEPANRPELSRVPRRSNLAWKQRVIGALAAILAAGPAWSQVSVTPVIKRGVQFLKTEAVKERQVGELALATLAIVKSGEKPTDPLVKGLLERVHQAALTDDFVKAHRVYDGTVVLMALTAADATEYFTAIQRVADQLMARQLPAGCWSYANGPADGDTSQTQYVILALWEAASVGVHVPVEVWDRAMQWHRITQDQSGGFTYHPRIPTDGKRSAQTSVTHTMSAAGLGSMIICRSQLPFFDRLRSIKDRELLIPVEEAQRQYQVKTTREQADNAIAAAEAWMVNNLTFSDPRGPLYYYLYGVERYGSLSEKPRIGQTDWYQAGAQFILSQQRQDGSWQRNYAAIVDTSFALLFLGRSTEKTLQRIRTTRLGTGTLIGGRGLPSEDSALAGMFTRRKSRFRGVLKAPVEDLLKILNDPETAESEVKKAATSIETVPDEAVVKAVQGNVAMLRRLARDPRAGVRRAALNALARTRDLTVVPILINGLSDPDPEVYFAARDGLRWVSRRPEGFGLPETAPSDPKVLAEAVAKWKAWFESLQIELDPAQKYDEP